MLLERAKTEGIDMCAANIARLPAGSYFERVKEALRELPSGLQPLRGCVPSTVNASPRLRWRAASGSTVRAVWKRSPHMEGPSCVGVCVTLDLLRPLPRLLPPRTAPMPPAAPLRMCGEASAPPHVNPIPRFDASAARHADPLAHAPCLTPKCTAATRACARARAVWSHEWATPLEQ